MPQKCRVCFHAERLQIESLIVSGIMGKKRIGEQFHISEGSIRHHEESCMKRLSIVKAREKMATIHDASLLDRTEELRDRVVKVMDEAEEESDRKMVVTAAETAHKFDTSKAEWSFRLKEMEDAKEPFTVEVVHVRNAESKD